MQAILHLAWARLSLCHNAVTSLLQPRLKTHSSPAKKSNTSLPPRAPHLLPILAQSPEKPLPCFIAARPFPHSLPVCAAKARPQPKAPCCSRSALNVCVLSPHTLSASASRALALAVLSSPALHAVAVSVRVCNTGGVSRVAFVCHYYLCNTRRTCALRLEAREVPSQFNSGTPL